MQRNRGEYSIAGRPSISGTSPSASSGRSILSLPQLSFFVINVAFPFSVQSTRDAQTFSGEDLDDVHSKISKLLEIRGAKRPGAFAPKHPMYTVVLAGSVARALAL